ncbi:MAG: hypothetical protein K0R16_2636 [Nitrososphaeraceae archaeon]|jgi:hypothetical protein|nr:hypothetical protein [Nitrososphaeraceae archaeon]
MNTKTILTFVTLAAAVSVIIAPSLMATAAAPNTVCEKMERLQKV